MNARSIHIVGGGVGGLALGIRLRQLRITTRVSEAGNYPRHRVCGEFISGHGIELLKELDLFDSFLANGGKLAKTMKFYGMDRISPLLQIPRPALCISRFAMDRIMSDKFKSLGGNLFTEKRVNYDELNGKGTVLAVGRKPTLRKHDTWTGYKFHVQGLKLDSDLEMHFSEGGYLGMCNVENDMVNVCGLIQSKNATSLNLRSGWKAFLRSKLNPKKHELLQSTQIVKDSICCVSGISYGGFQLQQADPLVSIGDRMSTIPPLTGNGMSLAIESACMASGPIARYATGKANWEEIAQSLSESQYHSFQKRLAVSVPLQRLLMARRMHDVKEYVIQHFSFFHKLLFALTR